MCIRDRYWLTAYVLDFLVRAGEQGYSVPTDAINRGNERLLLSLIHICDFKQNRII